MEKTVQVTGTLKSVYQGDKSDSIYVGTPGQKEGDTRITINPKGSAKSLENMKGQHVTVQTQEGEYQGKPSYRASVNQVAITGGTSQAVTTNKGYTPKSYEKPQGTYQNMSDERQESIVFQSSLKIAVELEVYNAGFEKRPADIAKVLSHAFYFAKKAMKPDLNRPKPEAKGTDAVDLLT